MGLDPFVMLLGFRGFLVHSQTYTDFIRVCYRFRDSDPVDVFGYGLDC